MLCATLFLDCHRALLFQNRLLRGEKLRRLFRGCPGNRKLYLGLLFRRTARCNIDKLSRISLTVHDHILIRRDICRAVILDAVQVHRVVLDGHAAYKIAALFICFLHSKIFCRDIHNPDLVHRKCHISGGVLENIRLSGNAIHKILIHEAKRLDGSRRNLLRALIRQIHHVDHTAAHLGIPLRLHPCKIAVGRGHRKILYVQIRHQFPHREGI